MSMPRPLSRTSTTIAGMLRGADAASAPRTTASAALDRPSARRWLSLVVLVSTTALAWIRTSPNAGSIVYAEDGRIFLGDQENHGFWPSLFAPYTGYLQFLPRLIVAGVRALTPLDAYPLTVALACAVVVGAISTMVFTCAGSVYDWLPFRLCVALITVLAPVAPIEVAGNVANIHWYALWGGFWLLLHHPSSRRAAVAFGLLAAAFALTEIQTVLLVPIALLRLRSSRDWVVRSGLLLGLALQFAGLVRAPRTVIDAHPPKPSLLAGWFLDVPTAVYTVPDATQGTLLTSLGPVVGVAAALPPLAALVYVLLRGTRPARFAAVGLAALSILVWLAAVWANTVNTGAVGFDVLRARPEEFVTTWFSRVALVPSRYSLVPSMCLAALPVLAAAAWWARRRASGVSGGRRAVVVPVLSVLVLSLSLVPGWSTRDGAPDWRTEVATARHQCEASGAQATLRTAPIGWSVDLPCSAFR